MGKKKTPTTEAQEVEKPKEEKPADKAEDKEAAEEDTPVVKELKAADDKYLELEREYEKEVQAIRRKFAEKQAPLLRERTELLRDTSACEGEVPKFGTPALRGFWLKAMNNLPALEDLIESWDEPVLEYLKDVTREDLDATDADKGFKLTLHFDENPYFTNETLWKEFHTKESSPYTGEMSATEIKASEIDWKSGKDVTVERTKKKVKGGGAKKQKAKETEEPRDSFFRHFLRSLKPGMDIPDDMNLEEARQLCDDDDDDDEALMELLMEEHLERGSSIKDLLIPFAVRWYTGEAKPPGEDDDDDEDEEEEDEDDDDDDDDDDEDDAPPKGKAQAKKGKAPPAAGGAKAEECKQQ